MVVVQFDPIFAQKDCEKPPYLS